MPVKLPPNASVSLVVERWRSEVLEPAAKALSGRDGRISATEVTKTAKLEGTAAHAADDVGDIFAAASGGVRKTVSVKAFVAAGEAYVRTVVERAAGANGKLSASETRLLGSLHADFQLGSTRVEIGVVSDLDSTVIPPEKNGVAQSPYPGVTALLHELEFGKRGTAGDVTYVTARSEDRVAGLDDYLEDHGLPSGPIETGVGTTPWVAQPEKVADIERAFDANPGQRFVLFGDTKHRDPEVYRELLARHPDRVQTVFIHKVTRTVSASRVEGMHVIENYAEAAAILYGEGSLSRAAATRVMKAARAEGLELTTAQMTALLDAHRPG